ncbi:MAG: AAA family ATPase [Patescibacteria group bacterium]|nr:AAA family ATPase [Patescibacteria group bacterium]
MEDKYSKMPFIVCPVCSGTGEKKLGLKCPACGGMGVGSFLDGKFLYWGLSLGKAVINLRHFKKSVDLVINSIAYAISLAGLAALAFWVWSSSAGGPVGAGAGDYLELFSFWRVKHWLILVFWISALSDMFIIYRLSQEEARKEKLKKFRADGEKGLVKIPDNWEELKKFSGKIDVSRAASPEEMKVVEEAFLLAAKSGHNELLPLHLFFSLLRDKEIISLFVRLDVDGGKLITRIKSQLLKESASSEGKNDLKISEEVKEILIEAYAQAYNLGQKKVKALNLILSCLRHDKNLAEILYDLEVDEDKIKNIIEWFRVNERLLDNYRGYKKAARFKPAGTMDRAYTAVATPVLNHFSHDLTRAAKWGRLGICVGRDKEIEDIFGAFTSGRTGVILVGPLGAGKRTMAEGLAQLMVEEDVPKFLRDKRLLELDVARLVSGATAAVAQERLLVIIDEIRKAGNIVLFIENIENIVGITGGGEESLELSEVLAEALNRRALFCLTAATVENYSKYIEGKALGDILVKVKIDEPAGNQAIIMAESKVSLMEGKYGVYFSYDAIGQAVSLSSRYIHDKYLPAKAIEILEATAVRVGRRAASDPTASLCTAEDVSVTVSEITGVPVNKITVSESKELLNLEEKIHEKMINQEEAVSVVSASLRRARAALREGKRPIANFLFLGPTGVGKTELAKTVSDIYFGSKDYMIRLDMSEYQLADSVKKMIGDVDGTRGYLTEAVRKKPFSLVLLDEFEKAHPDILNLFLSCFDDGRITDGQGRTIDFTNSIIIATSNAGSVFIQDEVAAGTDIEKIKEDLINKQLNKIMRPELINRFDGIVVFKPLTMDNVVSITKLMLNGIGEMLLAKGIGLRSEEEGVVKLAGAGYDPKFGARPLRRLLQDKIENEIANKILTGELVRRDTVVINKEAKIEIEKGRQL